MSHHDEHCPGLFAGLLDDAAVFPPGNVPLRDAVPAHLAHRQAGYGDMVGPLVVAAGALDELARVTAPLRPGSLDIAMTLPVPLLGRALEHAHTVPAVRVAAVEVILPAGMSAAEAVQLVGRHTEGDGPARRAHDVPRVFVELPRDERRQPLIDALAGAGYAAKLRTGGVSREMYPDEAELAGAVVAAIRARVPFKATAGLHHAIRNTDPATGFEQHGFLNVIAATDAALAGARRTDVAAMLADRDAARVAGRVAEISPKVRAWFSSFGTCSIAEPVAELAELGLLPGPRPGREVSA